MDGVSADRVSEGIGVGDRTGDAPFSAVSPVGAEVAEGDIEVAIGLPIGVSTVSVCSEVGVGDGFADRSLVVGAEVVAAAGSDVLHPSNKLQLRIELLGVSILKHAFAMPVGVLQVRSACIFRNFWATPSRV